MDDATVTILDAQRERMQHRADACEVELLDDGSVFTKAADGADPLHPDTITKTFSTVCKKADVSGVRLHDLRHLHATTCSPPAFRARQIDSGQVTTDSWDDVLAKVDQARRAR